MTDVMVLQPSRALFLMYSALPEIIKLPVQQQLVPPITVQVEQGNCDVLVGDLVGNLVGGLVGT